MDTAFVIPPQDGRILLPTDDELTPGTIPDPEPLLSLRGPEPVVERDGRIVCRLDGLGAILDAQGRLLLLTDGTRTLLEGLRPFIVSDDRWRDFEYEDCDHQVLPDGTLQITGRRTEGDVALRYQQLVKAEARELAVRYEWEALTDAHVHMWRHQVDFPVVGYGGGRFEAGETQGLLPRDRSPQPNLAQEFRQIRMVPPEGPTVWVSTSGPSGLVDERHYGVPGFRLGHYPAHGDIKTGQEWKVTLRIRVE